MGMNLRNLSFHINFELLGTYQTRKIILEEDNTTNANDFLLNFDMHKGCYEEENLLK